jgi:imidazole glycerol-phosphate synthase subunit HisH
MITILDTGIANVGSFKYKLFNFGIESSIGNTKEDILNATKLILPGVGHFSSGMNSLNNENIRKPLEKKVLEEKIPIFGICLGMQLFTNGSEEGNVPGLGWIDADTKRFDFSKQNDKKLKIPHVGWSRVKRLKNSILLKGIPEDHKYYFTHSYYTKCKNNDNLYATTEYGIEFSSIFQKGNIYGTQFHPEKSHATGFKVLINFIKYA